jgi:hypothetical protein
MVAAGTPFYNDWQLSAQRGSVGTAAIKCQLFGYRGHAIALQVKTGQGWPDGVSRVTMVYVDSGAVSGVVDAPPATGGGATEAQLLAARQEGYDLALSVFPPRPS